MRLYTIEKGKPPKNVGKSWEVTLRVRMNESSIPNYGGLDQWTRQNMEGPYILMAFMSQHISGGAVGLGHNANLSHCPDRPIRVDYYELRLTKSQAKAFLSKWTIPPDEYEKNIAYGRELDSRRQGWTTVDGKTVPTHKIVAMARKAKGFKRMCTTHAYR